MTLQGQPTRGTAASKTNTGLRIPYESVDFSPAIPDGEAELIVSWDDILWAALTVGRPNRGYVFQHGAASMYEAIFKLSLIRMALEQNPRNGYLRRTDAERSLDPSERGAVQYFLGMTFCKLFAAKLLNTPWLLHLDVFRPQLDAVLSGRSRPDLIGQESNTARWHAFECKGRVSPPDAKTKRRAKLQARRVVTVAGSPVSLHIGAISFFRRNALHFYWEDPSPNVREKIEVPPPDSEWRQYYEPATEMYRAAGMRADQPPDLRDFIQVAEANAEISLHPAVRRALLSGEWSEAHARAREIKQELSDDGYQPDGLRVRAGHSWWDSSPRSWGTF